MTLACLLLKVNDDAALLGHEDDYNEDHDMFVIMAELSVMILT